MQLYNKLSAKERATMLEEAGTERLTLSFYQYAQIGNPQLFRDHLFLTWNAMANYIINGGTYRLWKAIVVKWSRN